MPSADARSCWFCSQVLMPGRPIMNSSAITASVTSSSMSVKPYGRRFMGSAIRGFLPHPAGGAGVTLVRQLRARGDRGGFGVGVVHGERNAAEAFSCDADRGQHELLVADGVRVRRDAG